MSVGRTKDERMMLMGIGNSLSRNKIEKLAQLYEIPHGNYRDDGFQLLVTIDQNEGLDLAKLPALIDSLDDFFIPKSLISAPVAHPPPIKQQTQRSRNENMQLAGNETAKLKPDAKGMDFLSVFRTISKKLKDLGKQEQTMNRIAALYPYARKEWDWIPSNFSIIMSSIPNKQIYGLKKDDIRYLDLCIGERMLGEFHERQNYLEKYPDTRTFDFENANLLQRRDRT